MPQRNMSSQPIPVGAGYRKSAYNDEVDMSATNTARAYKGAVKDAPPSWHKPYSAPVAPKTASGRVSRSLTSRIYLATATEWMSSANTRRSFARQMSS